MSKFSKFIELSFRTLVVQYYYRFKNDWLISRANKYMYTNLTKFKIYSRKALKCISDRANNHEKIAELQKYFL